jgi:hypothetical protein
MENFGRLVMWMFSEVGCFLMSSRFFSLGRFIPWVLLNLGRFVMSLFVWASNEYCIDKYTDNFTYLAYRSPAAG